MEGWLVHPGRRPRVPGFVLAPARGRPDGLYAPRRRPPVASSGYGAARTVVPMEAHPVPKGAWGVSLSKLATRASWERVRTSVGASKHGACALCAARGPTHAHEVWDHLPPLRGGWGRQLLAAVVAVCPPCHDAFHPGRHVAHGRHDPAGERLAWLNGWTDHEAETHAGWTKEAFAKRSRLNWILDVGLVAPFLPEFRHEVGRWAGGPLLSTGGRRVPVVVTGPRPTAT